MFETLEDLNRTLPRPEMTGDPAQDLLIHERYINHARILRSEAFACIGRALTRALQNLWHHGSRMDRGIPAHRA